jgi:hypothetical protein
MRQQLKPCLLAVSLVLAVSPKALAGEDPTFTTIDFLGASFTAAVDINPRGDIVGRYISGGVQHGYLLSGGTFTTIDFPGQAHTQTNGINARGDIVGRYDSAGVSHGVLLSSHDDDGRDRGDRDRNPDDNHRDR